MQVSSIMQYLGRISGSGLLTRDGDAVARASYEFEGFLRPRGIIVSSGEIGVSPSALKAVFGRPGVQLRTDDGRLLDLRFSDKELRHADDVAQVEVTGDLPGSPAQWRGGSTAAPTHFAPAPDPDAASRRSEAPAANAQRLRRASA
ncbi:MAG: hypothetical protein ABSF49_06420 [Roseiarcus sp.]|jgi:hypothetical protein|uniref:hypothetical protein n=1 Tax=Roseiarcus sp. TaxID=1969460 RepID=UPI003C17C120